MSHKGGLIPALGKQAGRALVATILVFYTVALLAVILQGCRVQTQVRILHQQIAALTQERDALVEQLEQAKTDASVEKIAREELKMSRPGEQVRAPVQDTSVPSIQSPAPVPTPGDRQPSLPTRWLEWLKGLFRKRED
jgi:cell division protein FtsL